MLFRYALCAMRHATLLALIHLNSMILLLAGPKEYFPLFQMIQGSQFVKSFYPAIVNITSTLLDKTPCIAPRRAQSHLRKKLKGRNAPAQSIL